MAQPFWVFIGMFFLFLWIVYWQYIHERFKFKDKKYMKNKGLLDLDYNRFTQKVYHIQIIGFSFIIAGLTLIDKGTIAGGVIVFGFLILMIASVAYGKAERRYHWLRELLK